MEWKDITIRKYQELYPILTRKLSTVSDELDQQIDILVCLNGKSVDYYDSLTRKQFNMLTDYYSFLSTPPTQGQPKRMFKLHGYVFEMDYNSKNINDRLTGRDIIELTRLAGNEELVTMNMHKIIDAYTTVRKKWFRVPKIDKAEVLLDLDIQTAINITSFFLPLLEQYLLAIQTYLTATLQKENKKMEQEIANQKKKATGKGGGGK